MNEKPRKKNIGHVAVAAGVSVATVSRTLQLPEIVAEETRRRVHVAIRRIALIAGPSSSPLSADRRHGYEAALRAAGARSGAALMASGDFSAESGRSAVEELLARKERFTALFCSNDEMAIGAIRGLKAHGLRVPEDISVVGFDDIRFARYTDPPLTTMAQPKNELGREALNLLLEILGDTTVPTRKRVLAADLFVRQSTAAVPRSTRK